MYVSFERDSQQIEMFERSLPFGGKLNRENRWIRLAHTVDWRGFEGAYAKLFSNIGRPGVRARYVIGSLILKHQLGVSDDELVQQIAENPYMQYFIGLAKYVETVPYNASTLSRVRARLGEETFTAFEAIVIQTLLDKKLIKPRGLQVDATVVESDITYPTDCGLLNQVREFCVKHIRTLSKVVEKKVRTYCRVAKREYLNFIKKKRKTKKQVRRMHKSMLQHVRRNLHQLSELITMAKEAGHAVSDKVVETLEKIKAIYLQQKQMYDEMKKSIEARIVSLHKPYVRPIVRGKNGKDVEFGAKVALSYVDGYLFADKISFDNFNEALTLPHSLELFEKRFGKSPDYVAMDQLYGSRANRETLKEQDIRTSVKPLGRPPTAPSSQAEKRWRRRKQRERNRIEGRIGTGKTRYDLGLVRSKTPKTERSWIHMALLAQILMTANKKM